MSDRPQQHLQDQADAAVERLQQWLAIPSVSTDPAHADDIAAAAAFARDALAGAGLTATIEPTDGHPIVFGRTPDDQIDPDRPTVLFYGHYDVQPADPIDRWTTPPFEPTVRDGELFARGASDDKGQVACFLEALSAFAATDQLLPVNVKGLIEGEEEIGSPNLEPFLAGHREQLAADVVVVSDTTMWNEQTIAITYGLRGLLYFDLKLHGPDRDLHSGMYGGIVPNPAVLITRVLGQLFDDENRVTIDGFYDNVRPLDDEERACWEALDFDPARDCLNPIGVNAPFGEAGFSTLERKWARPSCDINGLYGGYGGEGAKTVIPATAGAKVSFRLAADQDPADIADKFRDWLKQFDVGDCRWEITEHGRARPVFVPTDTPWMDAARTACEKASGRPPALVREGATIPVIATFQQILGVDSLLIGFGLPEDAIHSPNEKIALERFHLGSQTHVHLLEELAKASR